MTTSPTEGAVERAARADDEADAEAVDDAAENGSEERILRDARQRLEHGRPRREEADGDERRDGEVLANLLVAEIEERQVHHDEEEAERHRRDRARHDGEADDAAVDDVVRNQEELEADGRDDGAEKNHHVLLDVDGILRFRFMNGRGGIRFFRGRGRRLFGHRRHAPVRSGFFIRMFTL